MPQRLKKCPKCQRYTLSPQTCPVCKSTVVNVHPPRFSLQDKYQEYRIEHFREKMDQRRKHQSL